jgi:cytoskeletal protein RodZ
MGCANENVNGASHQSERAASSKTSESTGPESSSEATDSHSASPDESDLEAMERTLSEATCTEQGVPSEMWVEREQLVLKLQNESQQQEWRTRLDKAQFETQCPQSGGETP